MKFTGILTLLVAWMLVIACTKNRRPATDTATPTEQPERTPLPKKPLYNRQEAAAFLQQWVDSSGLQQDFPTINSEKVAPELTAFYQSRDFDPAWGVATAKELVADIQQLDQEGLHAEAFPVESIQVLLDSVMLPEASAQTGARLDLLLSATYLKLADRLASGSVKPAQLSTSWHLRQEAPDTLFTHLQQAVTGQVTASLDALRPGFGQYSRLRKQLSRYKTMVARGGWPTIPPGPTLTPGDSSQRLTTLRERLRIAGDLPQTASPEPARYDSSLIGAVNRCQRRYGLAVQPDITQPLIDALNVSAEKRLKQIMLNLDRIRWISTGPMPDTYVLVNLPEFRLHVVEEGQEIKLMKVIVGKTLTSTPVFSDEIEYVEFSPYWNVPNSIAYNELWPKIRRSSSYLRQHHYEVLDGWGADARVVDRGSIDWNQLDRYRIRQLPGPWNALGQVKFMFPNQFAIYLHDTPSEHLFDKTYRAYSHGCIRIAEPAWFAHWLFPQFDREEIEEKMSDRQHEVVRLDEKIPVYIMYLTAFVDKAGRMNFRQDLYDMDKRLLPEFDAVE